MSSLRQLLARMLSRLLKFLASVGGFKSSPTRLIQRLAVFFAPLLRWSYFFKARKPYLRQLREGAPAQATTPGNNDVCTMNVPSPRHSDVQDHDQRSPVDLPYINATSQTSNTIPYSPSQTGLCSCSSTPGEAGSRASPQDEPTSSSHDVHQTEAGSISRPESSSTVHGCQGNPSPDTGIPTYPFGPPSPHHLLGGFTLETSSRSPSQLSLSQTSHGSGNSTGQPSHRGPPNTSAQTSASAQDDVSGLGNIPRPSVNNPDTPEVQRYEGYRFFPMSVSGVLRYDKRKIRPPCGNDYKIAALLYRYPETPEVPEGWTAHRHPEGALYFVHDKSKTFAGVDICDPEIHEDIEYFRSFLFSELQAEIKNQNLTESLDIDEVQLVLEPKVDEIGVMCCYYFVNPRTRSLFWLDEWEAYEIFKDCRGRLSTPHKGLAIQAQYWSHWDLYPNFCEITQGLKDEVMNMILHAACDHLTSNRSSCPLNSEELKKHLSLIERIDPEKVGERGHSAIIVGRIMHIFYNTYFLNFYGEDCARLNFDQSIHGWRYHPSLFMAAVAPMLFMTPVYNARLLHKTFVDEVVRAETWNRFVTRLNSELQGTTVLAIVLLNVYTGFLPRQLGTGISLQQLLDCMSIVASIASIILSLVFMGHVRNEARSTPFEAAKFLYGLQHERHGLETLAIVYSLPYAFLVWSIVLFVTGVAVRWCCSGDATARACVGALVFIVALLVAWCIWTTRVRSDYWWFQPDPEQSEVEPESDKHKGDRKGPGLLHLVRKLTMPKTLPAENMIEDTSPRDIMESTK